MQPEIHLGPITLQTFGLMFALGFIAAGAIVAKRLREWDKPPDWAYELIFAGLVGGIVGSRIDFLIQNFDEVSDDLLGNLFSGSCLVWYGGVIGGAIGVILWARWRGLLNVRLLDLCAVPLAVGYAVGRIGCQLSGDGDYGEPWDGPWAMAYPEGTVPTTEEVHPTPVYESLTMFVIAAVLWRLRDRFRPGILFALYLVLAGLERFLVEFVRRNEAVLAGLTLAQLVSLAMIVAGIAWIAVVRSRAGGLRAAGAEA
ncbi:MAG: prolipoprotein diacylglyceryl transferase [Solirubrobacterales bacterium]